MLDGQVNHLTITFLEGEWLSIFTVQWNPDFLNHLGKGKVAQIIG